METEKLSGAFLRLVNIMDELREQCPWDRKQTIHTLRTLSIEELYELMDAILSEDWPGIKKNWAIFPAPSFMPGSRGTKSF
jgi:XTP/dITP diphosphohydrolase